MTWLWLSVTIILVGAELNAEIEHASPYGKNPGEKVAGEKTVIGAAAERAWKDRHTGAAATVPKPAERGNCDVDTDLPPAVVPAPPPPRTSDWIITGVVVGEAMAMAYAKLRGRLQRVKT